jgi:uncharacterized protein YndB with AHSA1/START domain
VAARAFVRDGRGFAEVVVARPIAEVFDYLTDLRHMETWWSTHQSYRRVLGRGGPGTLYAWRMQLGSTPLAPRVGGLTVVTALQRPKQFAYRLLSPGLYTRMRYELAASEDGTRVLLEVRPGTDRLAEFAQNFPGPTRLAFESLATVLARAPRG